MFDSLLPALNILWTVVIFLFAIVILVAVHEFGHFWVARRCGVKVLRFSIGFGKVLFAWHDKHGTEYAFSAIPLGGYVKMLDEREDEVPEHELPYAFNRKSVYGRMAIVLAGPLFNFLFAIFAYWLMFIVGVQHVKPIVGEVAPQSIAAYGEIQPGSEFIAINGDSTHTWREVAFALLPEVGNGSVMAVTMKTDEGNEVHRQLDLRKWQYDASDPDLLQSIGITPFMPEIELAIDKVSPNSAAADAGIQAGDMITAIDNKPIAGWQQMVEEIAARPGGQLNLTIQRGDEQLQIPVTLESKINEEGKQVGRLGIQAQQPQWPEYMLSTKQYNVIYAWWPALKKTYSITSLSFEMLAKLVTGDVSPKSISGPVGIAQGAAFSASIGLTAFLSFLALISISLAIINILPIPMLDGGHFFYYLIEWISGKPVPEKVQILGIKIGLVFLFSLMALAIYNDIARW